MSRGCAAIQTMQNPTKPIIGDRQLHFLPCYMQSHVKGANPGPGIALFLEHGSILMEASAVEFHGATRVHKPNFYDPQRIASVCFCANVCDLPNHGHGRSTNNKPCKFQKIETYHTKAIFFFVILLFSQTL